MTTSTIKSTLFALTLIALLFGCVNVEPQPKEQVQEEAQENLHEVVFHAGWEPETKTVLQEDGSVWWSPGDEIALFGLNSGKKYRLQSNCEEPSPETDFVGMIEEGDDTFYAIYPYDKSRDLNNCFTIPTVQYAESGRFADGQFVSFARAEGEELTFYNACAGIKFSVAHEGVTKVVFKNRENCGPLAGDMRITFPYWFPDYPNISIDYDPNAADGANPKPTNELTVFPAEGNYFSPGEYYYASVRPGEASLIVSFYTDEQVAMTVIPVHHFWRSEIAILREKDKDLQFEDNNNDSYSYSYLSNPILPDGIDRHSIKDVIFHTCSDVVTETIVPTSLHPGGLYDYIPVYFELQGTTAHYYSAAERYMMPGPDCISFDDWSELRSVDLSMFCTNQVTDFQAMFNHCLKLESVNLSSFDTRNAKSFTAMFQLCKSLKTLDISNFSSLNLAGQPQGAECMFNRCYDLTKLDLGSFDLSVCGTSAAMLWLSKLSKNCAIRCTSATRDKLSDADSRLGSNVNYITWVLPEEELPELEPIVDPNLYTSTDYSKDKTVKILHKATKGNGVDIVLLGDAYSDRMIADGTYDADMELAMNAILKDEPYATFKDYINVYTVYAVSENEIPYESHTVFDASINQYDIDNGVLSYNEASEVYKYASIAFPDKDLEDVAMILIINQAEGDGDSFTDGVAGYEAWWNEDEYSDYASYAKSIGMINRRDRTKTETFTQIVAHEFGHVFAKLGDEYIMLYDEIPDWERNFIIRSSAHAGWFSNIDVTSDPQSIKWKKFLEDERYSGTGIGIFEGGYTHAFGVWHPTENSIMRFNQGMFNAPSREVIYKRIHKLAFGEDWQYDYEAFVEYDQKNIDAEKAALAEPLATRPNVSKAQGKPFMKIEKSITPDGKEQFRIEMN